MGILFPNSLLSTSKSRMSREEHSKLKHRGQEPHEVW